MLFRTEVEVPTMSFRINHLQQNMLIGSCFSENMGNYLFDNKFKVEINPFGITYNPFSAAKILTMLLDGYHFTDADVIFNKGLFFTRMHHSDFSEADKDLYIHKIQSAAQRSTLTLQKSENLIVTFGTAYVYLWKETGEIVNNCHKLPASLFERRRLSVSQIVDTWTELLSKLIKLRENIKILFTVSPIRHWKDGAHENQLSKSILLMAIDELQKIFPQNVFYFPSYEIILDELRDYRFYAKDLVHPNEMAVEYCWEKFSDAFFNEETNRIVHRWKALHKALSHRSFQPESSEHQLFLTSLVEKMEQFVADYPYIDCRKEMSLLKGRIIE